MRSIVLFLLLASLLVGLLAGAIGCNRKGWTPVFIKAPPATVRPKSPPAPQPIPTESPPVDSEHNSPKGTIFEEHFHTAQGAGVRVVHGVLKDIDNTKPETIHILPFYDESQKAELILRWLEDGETLGPDGKPGVLALTFENLPANLAYSGFCFLGLVQDSPIKLEPLAKATSADDLRGLRVRFRYRAVNTQTNDGHRITVAVRLESVLDNSYEKRLDLGTILATDEWKTFEADLSDAGNIDAFIQGVNRQRPHGFKLLFAQGVKAELYQPGDTLLIDDIEFVAK